MLSIKVILTKILTELTGKADKSSFGPTVLYNQTTNADATQDTYTEVSIATLANWNVVSVRCRVLQTTQQLIFVRGVSAESYLVYTDSSGTVTRGGFLIDWTNNKLKVRWTHGSANTNIYAGSVYGLF